MHVNGQLPGAVADQRPTLRKVTLACRAFDENCALIGNTSVNKRHFHEISRLIRQRWVVQAEAQGRLLCRDLGAALSFCQQALCITAQHGQLTIFEA